MSEPPFPNEYKCRQVAENDSRPCTICYKPTCTVLVASNKADHFYVCNSHVKDKTFASPMHSDAHKQLLDDRARLENEVRQANTKAEANKPYSWNRLMSNIGWEDSQVSKKDDKDAENKGDTKAPAKDRVSYDECLTQANALKKKLADVNSAIADFQFKDYVLVKDVYRMRINNTLQAKNRTPKPKASPESPNVVFPSVPNLYLTIDSVIVTDTGEFDSIAKFTPQDATTNLSLIFAASKKTEFAKVIKYAGDKGSNPKERGAIALSRLLVEFGKEMLQIVPGRASTEVDARLSFAKDATIKKALEIIELYKSIGISKDRILIRSLLHGNVFKSPNFAQAVICAGARVTLISPFVGRIMDWYKAATGKEKTTTTTRSTTQDYCHGCFLRKVGEIKALAGCDYLTVAPKLLEELVNFSEEVPQILNAFLCLSPQSHRCLTDVGSRYQSFAEDAETFLGGIAESFA